MDFTRLTVYAARFARAGLSDNMALVISATLSAIVGAYIGKHFSKSEPRRPECRMTHKIREGITGDGKSFRHNRDRDRPGVNFSRSREIDGREEPGSRPDPNFVHE